VSEGRDVRHFAEVWRRKSGAVVEYRPGDNRRVDLALRLLTPGRRLLDVGCGAGLLAGQARDRFAEVHGVDIAESAVTLAREQGVAAAVVNLNEQRLPYEDGFFDAVTALSSLQYVEDVDATLAECARVLRSGGRLLVGVPNMRALWRLWTLGVRGVFPRTSMDDVGQDGGTLHYFTHESLARMLRQRGFVLRSSHGVFCIPRALERVPDGGLAGRLKREFFSAEVLVQAERP
jgi:ubiquinone/menaquinone biosynthesis C-methylase UbiE